MIADWQDLYQRAKANPALRLQARAALPLVDTQIGEGHTLGSHLLDRLARLDAGEPPD